jgi:dTDP-4-dehydrorhamnose reductase
MIWLVGKNGMLGSEVVELLETAGLEYCASDIEVDITDSSAIEEFVQDKPIDWVVNCAAYTAVDNAEDNIEAAERLNIHGPGNLAATAAAIGARIIHISTDYVFGSVGEQIEPLRPLTENDPTGSESEYGRTKLLGEQAVAEQTSRYFIIRIAWLYGKWGKNFVYTMLRLLEEKQQLKVVDDQVGCPTWSREVAWLIRKIIESDSAAFGTYHYCGRGQVSWYGFTRHIAEYARELGLVQDPARVEPCSSAEFPTKARRPKWSVLSTAKAETTFGLTSPAWQQSLHSFLSELSKERTS